MHEAIHSTPRHTPLSQRTDLRPQFSVGEQLPLAVHVKVHELGPEEDVNVDVDSERSISVEDTPV
jgi:hypothetical protein